MLHKIMGELHGKDVLARDGTIGSVEDVYFDDQRWAVRYLVVDTGGWLPGRKVLISPASLADDQHGKHVRVDLTREQVRNSPSEDSAMPVSRQFEEAHARYYGYPFYWDGPFLWGSVQRPISGTAPVTAPPGQGGGGERSRELREAEEQARHSHLRSDKEVVGYRVVAKDGAIGHVDDFLLDDRDWAINGLVIDTRDWLPGKKVTVAPEAVHEVDWATREVRVDTTRDEIEHAPKAP